MCNLSENHAANRYNTERRDRASSLSFGAFGHWLLSVDSLGPEDENGFSFIVVIVDNFSKFVGLYPARRTTSKDFIGALLQFFWGNQGN